MVLLFNPLCTTLWKLMVLWIIFFTMPISSVGMTTKMMTKDSNNTSELHENCPVMCRCPTPETVDCSQAKLTDIPHDISQKAINLLLNGNRLSEISDECFSMCPRIQTLNLKGNEISEETISKNAFYALSNLHHLYLSQNKLQKIPKDLPNSIISLNLEGNFIHEVDDFALAQKQHLRRLYLHNNNITSESLSKKAFRRLLKLEEITLSNNFMQAIPLFPDYIERLHMENNQISGISSGIFRKKKKLIALYLQNNNLINEGLSSKSFTGLNRLEYLDLSNNELKEIPENIPKNIRRLHLEKNHLEKITHKSLAALQKLEYLLLQYNNLNSSSIDPGSFSKLRSLKTLHIFTNNLETVPSFLPPRLEYLILLSNGIKKLKRNTFAGARQIRDLNMRYNKITNSGLEKGAFRPLPRLTTIDLSGNQLTAVPSLPRSAEVVHLSDNRIVRIPHKSITRLSRLYHLVLSGNKLQTIANDIFKDSIKMKVYV
uniref:podocan-like n=1 Tax=Styela clava TaxID=7725 RepID=UPI00193A0502|nr:podocan-like [Styela clava]